MNYGGITYKEFCKEIQHIGLKVLVNNMNTWSIRNPKYANPMLFFDPTTTEEEYTGTINVKAINIDLFTKEQIKHTLFLVNKLILTPFNERGEI